MSHQLLLKLHTGGPQLVVGHVIDTAPYILIVIVRSERVTHRTLIYLLQVGSRPCGEVHAVGHITYVELGLEITGPHTAENIF